tara:strand:+ start:158 stop:1534 length:1377 start_codon:yes stop_codon:yes gene_type:complete
MSTYLGQKGYTIFKDCIDVKEQMLIRSELEVKPFTPKGSFYKPQTFLMYRESNKKIYVPRFYGIQNYGNPDEIRMSEGKDIHLKFSGTLRPHQVEAVDAFLKSKDKCGLLEIYCGGGKTVCSIKIIELLKKKTLIIVHKSFLMNQWKERIAQFLPEAKIGIIQGEKFDIENKDIVLGMLQSLSMKDYPASMFQEFGLTLVDECHHISSEVFSRALFKIVTKHMLGLSATMKRKDGLTWVFKLFLGDIVYSKKREGCKVLVKGMKYKTNDGEFGKMETNFRGEIAYARMINKICNYNRRSEYILKIVENTLQQHPNQQILILGQNKSILKYLYTAIESRNMATVGYYLGGMKQTDLKISETKEIIIATYAMASEGLDIKTLSILILATPRSDVTQAVGRVLRQEGIQALVIDIIDQHGIFQRQWTKRRRFYKRSKFEIQVAHKSENNHEFKNSGICWID